MFSCCNWLLKNYCLLYSDFVHYLVCRRARALSTCAYAHTQCCCIDDVMIINLIIDVKISWRALHAVTFKISCLTNCKMLPPALICLYCAIDNQVIRKDHEAMFCKHRRSGPGLPQAPRDPKPSREAPTVTNPTEATLTLNFATVNNNSNYSYSPSILPPHDL